MLIISIKTTRNVLLALALGLPAHSIADACRPSLNGDRANLTPIVHVPVITGHPIADNRLRKIAESRGYRQQLLIARETELAFPWSVHRCMLSAWQKLNKAANQEGFRLSIVSGYRSLQKQRQIFVSKLNQYGIRATHIMAGVVDDQIHAILDFSAPPGYSRHHSGFTVDIQNAETGLGAFGASPAYAWLARDNYRVAREFGFVPSYPEGIQGQGPLPEPWEFIWVGNTDDLISDTDIADNELLESARRILFALEERVHEGPVTGTQDRSDTDSGVRTLPGG
jgi:LAS superfamily LD-carboxypeptidase LdcB